MANKLESRKVSWQNNKRNKIFIKYILNTHSIINIWNIIFLQYIHFQEFQSIIKAQQDGLLQPPYHRDKCRAHKGHQSGSYIPLKTFHP